MDTIDKEYQELDLPLSSNFNDVKIKHFILDLNCNLKAHTFHGILTIFCKMSTSTNYRFEATEGVFCPEHSVPIRPNILCGNTEEKGSKLQHNENEGMNRNRMQDNISNTDSACNNLDRSSVIILDSFAIDVENCYIYDIGSEGPTKEGIFTHLCIMTSKSDLQIPQCCLKNYYEIYTLLEKKQAINIAFTVSDCKLTMFLPSFIHTTSSEIIVRIVYKTQPKGPSLMWTVDQMQRPCVFTIGHQLNNRSLFPSQDMPQAMSTWHCNVALEKNNSENLTVLMTGERLPEKMKGKDGGTIYHFHNSYPMPAATFALAIGEWCCTDLSELIISNNKCKDNDTSKCFLFSPPCLLSQSLDQLQQYVSQCFLAFHSVLGPYPLKHLSILIAPACFDSLGMACPHLLILSQSILCPDLSMLLRLSHELCHTWFGILTGPKDWTEEWLTEGVCCYLEDILHGMVMKWDHTEYQDRSNLRALIKYRLLASEISNTPEHLQTLRPNCQSGRSDSTDDVQFVKNGLDPEKTVLQVHYLKGFFLLRHLERLSGREEFLSAIKTFINQKLGHLFSSKEFLQYIFDSCPKLRLAGITVDEICKEWLDVPGMPQALNNISRELPSRYIQEVNEKVAYMKSNVSPPSKLAGKKPRKSLPALQFLPEQRILFMDLLQEESVTLSSVDMKTLREIFNIPTANAEVQHSWCELVISQRATRWLCDVKTFLIQHQAMGVYLYGELMISEDARFQKMAIDCFSEVEKYMPKGTLLTVKSLLFPD